MENFKNTEFEGMSEEDIFLENKFLVPATIFKKFPEHKSYCSNHMLELDDLIQQGNLGLLSAIRSFAGEQSSSSFRTYAINQIIWSIKTNMRKESLRNLNSRTIELVPISSGEELLNQDDDITIIESLKSPNNTSEDAEGELLKREVRQILEASELADEDLIFIILSLIEGKNHQEIANKLGKHRSYVLKKLTTKKANKIKAIILKKIRGED